MTQTLIPDSFERANARPATDTGSVLALEQLWRERLEQSKNARKRNAEPAILSDLAFAAGQQWLVYDEKGHRMRHISEQDPWYAERELYTADRIREYRAAQLGELNADSDRPQLLAVVDGNEAQAVTYELNQAAEHGWNREWHAEDALRQARRYCVDMGVAAIRCRWDPSEGQVAGHLPVDKYGQPITADSHPEDHAALQTTGQLADGSLPQFKAVKEGRTCWEPLTALHLLPPPGINHEKDFPHFAVGRPVPIPDLEDLYGTLAVAGLTEDTDIASLSGVTTQQQAQAGQGAGSANRLRGHVWLYTCYDLPSPKHPDGRVTVVASNQYRLLTVRDQLDYKLPDGSFHTGVVFFHWERHSDRFWSRSMIGPMKDPQRLINRRKTQNIEIIDRAMPKVYVERGSLPDTPEGPPMEVVEIEPGKPQPTIFQGMGPGSYMYNDIATLIDDLGHASTLSALRLGENPQNVDTYSQLAQLNENEQVKRSEVRSEHQQAVGKLVELSMVDALRYWPDGKWLLVSGEEDQIRRAQFQKAKLPPLFMAKIAPGAPEPRSQAAELKKIDAIWGAFVQSGAAERPDLQEQLARWYAESVEAGKAQPLPEPTQDAQTEVAEYENLMMQHGDLPQPAPHDLQPIHFPIHREALDRARAGGDLETAARIQLHIDTSIQQIVIARKTLRAYDPSDTNDQTTALALDEDQALRENDMMVQGIPLNPDAYQKALTQLQQGINPETGGPVQQGDDLAGILQRAALKPTLVENLELHLERHGNVIKSAAFQMLPDDVRQRFSTHFDLTRQIWLSLPQMPDKTDSPKVTLNLRESVGPSTIAKVMARAGIPEADPGEIGSEPPLENVVQADVTEPQPVPAQPQQPQTQ